MAKDNRESVKDYHKQLKDMKIRFPKADDGYGIPDYAEIIKTQASKLGKSANDYILDLIENDIQTNVNGIHDKDFSIERSMRELKNRQI